MHSVRLSSLAVALCVATACNGAPAAPNPSIAALADPGAASRQAVLDRYADGAPAVTLTTPSIMGRSPENAEALLAELGLTLHLVPFDRRRPVTVQHPPAGQPAPLDGVIEGWLGRPPEEVVVQATTPPVPPQPAAVQSAVTQPTPTPTATATEAPLNSTDTQVATRYILPPHTDGLLRTNPRRLAAVPLGTELTGNASWYGPGFHGLTTACGGVFDQNAATIATRELRCGTVVRITGPSGLTVEATVTDWGPAEWTGRRFDLSAAVFNAIAPLGAGIVPVRMVTANVPA